MHRARVFDQVAKLLSARQRPRRKQPAGEAVSSIAPHIDVPVSSAIRSMVSIVVLPMPRGGVLITRCMAIESSGFPMTFRYEIMSLISARS